MSTSQTVVLKERSKRNPLWSQNFLSNWFFVWVVPILKAARTSKPLLFDLRSDESSRKNVESLESTFIEMRKSNPETATIFAALYQVFGREYLSIAGYKFAWTVFTWAGAWYLLKIFLQYLTAQGTATGKSGPSAGYVISILLLLTSIASSICIHQQYAECNRVGIKVRAAISGLVYRKSLRLSRVKGGAGEVINIISADVTRINDAVVNFHFLWSAFVEVALIIILAFYEIGLSAFPAVFFILVLLPIQMYLGRRTSTLSRCQTEQGTIRVHNMSEILTAIKLIKFYAWELPFTEQVSAIREKEMGYIYANMMNKTVNYTVVFAIPVLAALSSLTMYVKYDRPLTASVSFTVLSLFNTLRYPFFMLPMAVKATAGAVTSFARLDRFMALEEVVPLNILKPPTGSDLAFEMNDCDFNWDGAEGDKPALSRISLKVKRGQKVAIVGDVGCGKSSLLAALLGQIRQTRGEPVKMYGTTAYMSQEAWLLNLTLRDNVTFGKPYDIARYKETIRVCSLQRDLTLLISGDRTEIAERGANLSGGQRQRVSLARTVYYDADILLLDDPLSAVDQHVGRHIFEECFQKNLKDKTVIVVLNQLQYLESMDYVVFVKDGAIKSQGSYDYLITTDELFKDMVASQVADSDEIEDPAFDEGEPMNVPDFDPDAIAPREPLESEDYMGSNDLLVPPAKTAKDSNSNRFLAMNSLSVSNRSQLAAMVKINESTVRSMIGRQNVTTISGAERDHDIAKVMMRNELSTYSVHHFKNALKEEAEEEDKAAIAKGKLVVEDDSTKTAGAGDFAAYAREGSGTTVTILMMITFVLVHGIRISGDFWLRLWVPRIGDFTDEVYIGVYAAFTALFSIGVFFRGYFFTAVTAHKAVKLHDKLFDATMHAPMSFFDTTPVARLLAAFSKHALHVDDTMPDAGMQALQYFPLGLGALLICAILIPWNWAPCIGVVLLGCLLLRYSTTADFATKSLEATTKPPIFSHLTCTLEGLFSIRAYHAEKRFDDMNLARLDTNHENLFAMQSVKSFQALYLDILSSLVIFFSALLLVFVRDTNGIASVAGLALSNALQMLVFVQWTVRQWGEVETQMSSVGQLVYYGKTQPEAPFDIPATKPPSTWPSAGLIKFQNIELKYQKFGVSVLKNISCTIYPREKIGIVGRTGSGKSTLLVSLLRIVESYEGMITIDDVDVSKIGLHDLRNQIAIIPQEPVMFVGTMRSNLDPFLKASDEEIWKALDAVHLGEKIRAMPNKLDTAVAENGKSVSQGQRQLLCIARAILCKAKVLVLDEATASLDQGTDLLIQEAIKTNFSELTMLTIAHRLNTIIECDRVMVMDAGKILEFDEPYALLKDPNGSFRALIDQTGPGSAQKLTEVAQKCHDERVAAGYDFPKHEPVKLGPMTVVELAAGKH